jgi:hypothetical protein
MSISLLMLAVALTGVPFEDVSAFHIVVPSLHITVEVHRH